MGVGAGGGVAGAAVSKTTVGSCVGVVVRGAAIVWVKQGGSNDGPQARAARFYNDGAAWNGS